MRHAFLTVAAAACSVCLAQTSTGPMAPTAGGSTADYLPVQEFDERRDATADIRAAIMEAQRTHKRVLVYVGGNWCPYCQQMAELLRRNPYLLQLRDSQFITVPVAYGYRDNTGAALAPYGKVLGVPHFFVLDSDGTLLQSQHVVELRENGDYDATKMRDFLNRWSGGEKKASK